MIRTLLFFCVALLASALQASSPIPDDAAIAKARQQLSELYGADLAKAKTPDALAKWAKELFETAGKVDDDKASQYVLLVAARKLAIQANDKTLAVEITKRLIDLFQEEEEKTAEEWLKSGDTAIDEAKSAKTPAKKLALQMQAVECYLRAREKGKGLTAKIAEKKVNEAEIVTSRRQRTFAINARDTWQPTVHVNRNQQVTISASGHWRVRGGSDQSGEVGPDGGDGCGWLECKIGNGMPVRVGSTNSFTAKTDGVLFFQMHDSILSDNSGSLYVVVSVQ